jgi:hypothetical protein
MVTSEEWLIIRSWWASAQRATMSVLRGRFVRLLSDIAVAWWCGRGRNRLSAIAS